MFYNRPNINILLSLLLCFSLLLPTGYVDASITSAKIISITGDVQVMRAGGEKAFKAFVNMRLTEGDRIITGRSATTKVEIDSERIITLTENTRIYLSELRGSSTTQQSSIALQSGGVGSSIKSALTGTSRFEIRTPTAVMGVRGTEFFTSYNNGEIDVRVITGAVNVNASVSGGASAPPAPPAPQGQQGPTTPPAPSFRPVLPPAPPAPPPPEPGVPAEPSGIVSFTVGAMQQVRFTEQSSPEQLLAPPQPLSLDGLDTTFIDRVAEISQQTPEIIPETIRNTIPEARQQAEARSEQRANYPNVAPDEFRAPTSIAPGSVPARQIIRSVPSTFAPPAPPAPSALIVPPAPSTQPPAPPTIDTGGGDETTTPTVPTVPNVTFSMLFNHIEPVSNSLTVPFSTEHSNYAFIELESVVSGISYTASSSNSSVASVNIGNEGSLRWLDISLLQPGTSTIIVTASASGYNTITRSFTIIAEIVPDFFGGTGTDIDPYLISTSEHLNNVRKYLGEQHSETHFKLVNNIDLITYLSAGYDGYNDGTGWLPIGDKFDPFTGTFDGNGHTISNLYINNDDADLGLFGNVENAVVTNIKLASPTIIGFAKLGGLISYAENSVITNIEISDGTVTGDSWGIGGVVGHALNIIMDNITASVTIIGDRSTGGVIGEFYNSQATNINVTGSVQGGYREIGGFAGNFEDSLVQHITANVNVSGDFAVGGFAGYVYGFASDYVSTNIVTTGNVIGREMVGGLIGDNQDNPIHNSYATGTVNADVTPAANYRYIGGLVGSNWGSDIVNSYATGSVNGYQDVGGLIGNNTSGLVNTIIRGNVESCYSIGFVTGTVNVGGLVGNSSGTPSYTNCYWNTESSNQANSAGGVGKYTHQMTQQVTFTDWNFDFIESIWAIQEGISYPYLQWQNNQQIPLAQIPFPYATNVFVSGSGFVDESLTGHYTYNTNHQGHTEGATIYRWLKADSADGVYEAIPNATNLTYSVTTNDIGKYMKFEVTVIDVENNTGYTELSAPFGPIPSNYPTVASVDSYYVVDNTNSTISAGIAPINTDLTVESFTSNLVKHSQAQWKVVIEGTVVNTSAEFDSSNGKSASSTLLFGDRLVVKAEDETVKTYNITVTLGDPVLGGGPHPGTPSGLKDAHSGFTWGIYRYWVYDFDNNSTAIQIVAYNQSNQIIQQWQRSNGTCRYISGVTIDTLNTNILFHTTQGVGTITVPWNDLLIPQP